MHVKHMKRAVIFLNGDRIDKKRVLEFVKKTDTILCADGGSRHAFYYGIKPDVVLGDGDSTTQVLKKKLNSLKIKQINYPSKKDQTDSELVINYAILRGFKEILLFGINGTRLDHMLGTLLFLVHHTDNILITVIEKHQILTVLRNHTLFLRGKKGDYVSLIPMTVKVSGVTTTGLKYALHNASLPFGKTLGLSNELAGKKASVTITLGTLLIIHTDV